MVFLNIAYILDKILSSNLLGIVFGAILVYWFGLKTFRKQRSYDEFRKKYVDEGLEALYNELAGAHSAFQINWERAHQLLRLVRDWQIIGYVVDVSRLDRKFDIYRPRNLAYNYLYKVNYLVGDETITRWTAYFFGELSGMQTFYFQQDLFLNIENFFKIKEKSKGECKEFYQRQNNKLEQLKKKINGHLKLLDWVGYLTNYIRSLKISCSEIPTLRRKPEIKQIIENIKADFEKIQESTL